MIGFIFTIVILVAIIAYGFHLNAKAYGQVRTLAALDGSTIASKIGAKTHLGYSPAFRMLSELYSPRYYYALREDGITYYEVDGMLMKNRRIAFPYDDLCAACLPDGVTLHLQRASDLNVCCEIMFSDPIDCRRWFFHIASRINNGEQVVNNFYAPTCIATNNGDNNNIEIVVKHV